MDLKILDILLLSVSIAFNYGFFYDFIYLSIYLLKKIVSSNYKVSCILKTLIKTVSRKKVFYELQTLLFRNYELPALG